jgi:hypothetical protein
MALSTLHATIVKVSDAQWRVEKVTGKLDQLRLGFGHREVTLRDLRDQLLLASLSCGVQTGAAIMQVKKLTTVSNPGLLKCVNIGMVVASLVLTGYTLASAALAQRMLYTIEDDLLMISEYSKAAEEDAAALEAVREAMKPLQQQLDAQILSLLNPDQ